MEKKLLICIYSSHEDLNLAKDLRTMINRSKIAGIQKNYIVLTDTNQKTKFRVDNENDILYLNTKECYTWLSLKTELMIEACVKLFDFDFLVKWDASTYENDRCYTERDCASYCLRILSQKDFYDKHYHGHIMSVCDGESSGMWFMKRKSHFYDILLKEGRDLECKDIIPNDVSYCRGKFYIMDRQFCEFIDKTPYCREIFKKNFLHNYGCEDISIGMCYNKFEIEKLK